MKHCEVAQIHATVQVEIEGSESARSLEKLDELGLNDRGDIRKGGTGREPADSATVRVLPVSVYDVV
ncbi:MAG: hypothetical protein ACE5E5_13995 [Phycisphaerae bacterium]